MSKLDEMIRELCPDGVETFPLEECCNILDKKRKPVTKNSREKGEYPYYGANGVQDYVSDYIFNGKFVLVGEDGSVITKSGTPVVTWAEGKIWVNNHAHVIEEKSGTMLRYLYFYIQTIDVTSLIHGNIPKLTGRDFRSLKIALPPLEVQSEIVRILDNFTELTSELTAELTARKTQYSFYRSRLLTFDANVEWKTVDEIAEVTDYVANGSFAALKENVNYKHTPDYAILVRTTDLVNGFDEENLVYIDKHAYNYLSKSKLYGGEIIINNIGAGVGTTFLCPCLDTYMSLAPNSIMVKTNNNKFYYYWLNSKEGQNAIRKIVSQGSLPKFNKTGFRSIRLPVPPLDVQNRIVNVLDNFEKICSDLNIGLPAEIEARQKQYEYYRDKLLTFKEVAAT